MGIFLCVLRTRESKKEGGIKFMMSCVTYAHAQIRSENSLSISAQETVRGIKVTRVSDSTSFVVQITAETLSQISKIVCYNNPRCVTKSQLLLLLTMAPVCARLALLVMMHPGLSFHPSLVAQDIRYYLQS